MTFFSGTDVETLRAEGSERNNFVSLIVNNAGSYTAAITRKVHSRKNITNDVYYEFFGEGTKNDKLSTELEVDEIEYYNLKITKESEAFLDIEERLKEIQKSKVSRPSIPNNYMCRVQQLPFNDPIMDNKEENTTKTPTVVKKEENMENSSDSKVDSRMVRSLVIQLLTGSVLMNTETFNMDNWLKNMKLSYDKRFGSPQSLEFVGWSQTISEFITYYIDPENNEIKQSEYAKAILDELLKYPSNPYLDVLKDEVSCFVEV